MSTSSSVQEGSQPIRAEFAREYAAFAAGLRVEDVPDAVREAARVNLLDTLACATAGANAPGVAAVADLALSWGGARQATLWTTGHRLPAHHAAWVNGTLAHARDFDDTHDAAVLHAGVSVVPAALAAAELNPAATGADLLAGLIAGLELICRLGTATTIGIIESGFIYTSLFGYFGATAAAARVLGLSAEETQNALGIAFSQTAGTHQVTRDAALTKRMQPGLAAKAALLSVQLTRAGIRGAQNVFEGEDGLFRIYLRDRYDPDALREGLGRVFPMNDLSYKPYPCCRFDHTAIDAALLLRDKLLRDKVGAMPDRIVARVNSQSYQAVCTPPEIRRHPRTVVQAQFSIPYTVACALIDGRVGLEHFTDAALARPDLLALAARVECEVDEAIEREWSRSISPTHLTAHCGPVVFQERVDLPSGHPQRPMPEEAFAAKLRDCMAFGGVAWPEGRAAAIRDAVADVERLERAADLAALLAVEGG
jgi:2-methylcitrate dehydratase PrpD